MTTAVWDQFTKVEPKRDPYGRYLIGGKPYTRVTTFAASIDDRHNLELWGRRMVALGLVERSDLFAQVAANYDDKKLLNRLCEDAIEAAKGSAGANTGSALHSMTERVDRGEDFMPPAPWDADLQAYRDTLAASGVRILPDFIERVVVNHTFGIAGTFDRIIEIDGYDLPLIADLKTGSVDHSFGAIAVQLAAYAYADELYDPATDTTSPMVEVDTERAVVVHLPAGQATCTLHIVDIKQGWEAARLCAQVRQWRQNRQLAVPFTTPDRRTYLAGRVENLRDRYPEALADLAGMWPEGVPTFKSGATLDADQLDRIALAVSTVEAKHSVAFGESDPADRRPDTEQLAALNARLAALPVDLLEAVNTAARRLDLPNINTRQFRQRHVADAEQLLADAEQAAASRWDEAQHLLDHICAGDLALHPAVHDACASDGSSWSAQQLDVLRAISRAAEQQHLVWTEGVLCTVDAEQQLVSWHGGTKRDALAAVKQIADAFGLAKPRSISDAALNPTLVALSATAVAS